jgi:uncharacterized protein
VEGAVTRALAAALCFAVAAFFLASPAASLDCTAKPTETDRLLCGSQELEQSVGSMWAMIDSLSDLVSDDELAVMAADQRHWLDQWARSCDPKTSPAGTVVCLRPALNERMMMLSRRNREISAQPFDIGGLPLTTQMTPGQGCVGKAVIQDTVIADCVYRIDPLARYRSQSVDALAFVANGGGAAYICDNFPVYVVAVRRGQPPEVARVPAKFGDRRGDACVTARRAATGFTFTEAPAAGSNGWSQEWTPEGGLSQPVVVPFTPQPGTTMRDYRHHLLVENEQFLRTLQRLAAQAGEPVEDWVRSFAFASEVHRLMTDELPDFPVFDGCSDSSPPGDCYNGAGVRGVYDAQADRLYFARIKGEADCRHPWRRRDGPDDFASSTFLPPLREWTAGALDALRTSHCGPH